VAVLGHLRDGGDVGEAAHRMALLATTTSPLSLRISRITPLSMPRPMRACA
jgi:hypothetical protein